jgi:hypothetical protein
MIMAASLHSSTTPSWISFSRILCLFYHCQGKIILKYNLYMFMEWWYVIFLGGILFYVWIITISSSAYLVSTPLWKSQYFFIRISATGHSAAVAEITEHPV